MAKVTKHDGKEEGEGHHCEDGRVHFAVISHSVGVDNGLEAARELVGLEVGGWGLVADVQGLDDSPHLGLALLSCLPEGLCNLGPRRGWDPGFSHKDLGGEVQVHLVQGVVYRLFLAHQKGPRIQV